MLMNKKGNIKYKCQTLIFLIPFWALLIFQCIFDLSGRISQELITKSIKSIKCEETSFPLKRRYIVFMIK